jgi:hypothetical protein
MCTVHVVKARKERFASFTWVSSRVFCEDAVVLLAVRSNDCNALKCMHFVHLKVAMRCDSIEPAMRCSGRCEKEGAIARVRDMYRRCHVVQSTRRASSITVSRVCLEQRTCRGGARSRAASISPIAGVMQHNTSLFTLQVPASTASSDGAPRALPKQKMGELHQAGATPPSPAFWAGPVAVVH